jgi:hypothetical protein
MLETLGHNEVKNEGQAKRELSGARRDGKADAERP